MYQRSLHFVLALAPLCAALSCAGYTNVDRDIDRTPVMNTGVGATVLMPGQATPAMPGSGTARAPGTAGPGTPSRAEGGGAAPSSGSVTFLGGTEVDEKRHVTVRSEPRWLKVLGLPFAVAAYPFKKGAELIRGEPQPGPAIPDPPRARPAVPEVPPDAEAARERAELERMHRELTQRGADHARAEAPPAPRGASPRTSGPGPSIADELAWLRQGRRSAPSGSVGPPLATPRVAPGSLPGETSRALDRDRDGRPDHWAYRAGGALLREVFDENGDGAPDRTVRYDPRSGDVATVEEDMNRDGVFDSWAQYADSKLARRRADADGDGSVDTWTFYRNGEITRHEQDTDADGFRDRIGYYEGGRLVREELDRHADGRPDLFLHYDGDGRVHQREEDLDGDGVVDVRATYRDGKLARRDILTDTALAQAHETLPAPDAATGQP